MTTLRRPRRLSLLPTSFAFGLFVSAVALGWGCSGGDDHPNAADPDATAEDSAIDTYVAPADAADADVCATSPTTEGCPCATEGQSVECGKIVKKDGGYVTCSQGYSHCTGGVWGACEGDRFFFRSTGSQNLSNGGAQPLYLTGTCANVCDPNPNCTDLTGQVPDVDAAGVYPGAEGGVSLVPNDATIGEGGTCAAGDLRCQLVACSGVGVTTTVTGVVYDPAGKNPLYGATVYVPLDAYAALPTFSQGVTCDTCSGAAALNAKVTTTAADGSFILRDVPASRNLAGTPFAIPHIPIVVQMGKWRREILLNTVVPCVSNSAVGNCTAAGAATDPMLCMLRLPRSQSDGYNRTYAGGSDSNYNHADMPQIAMVSGAADPLECMLMKAGISPTEISSYERDVGTGAVHKLHFYESPSAPGSHLDPYYGTIKTATSLWTDATPALSGTTTPGHYGYYDVVLDACEGGAYDKHGLYPTNNTQGEPYYNLIKYTGVGGRAFLTHFSYVWLNHSTSYVPTPENWVSSGYNVATWTHTTGTTYTNDPLLATINTGFPKGIAFADWLQNVGASTTYAKLNIHEGRRDLSAVSANTQNWMTAPYSGTTFSPHFTFNTPYTQPAANQCGRVVYSDFHVSASALVSGTGTCYDDSDCGFGQTCSGHPGTTGQCNEPCVTADDCPNPSTYACTGSSIGTATCRPTNPTTGSPIYSCTVGTCGDTVGLNCYCTANSQCASGTCVNQNHNCDGLGPCAASGAYPFDSHMCAILSLPTPTYSCSTTSGGSGSTQACAADKNGCGVCTKDSDCANVSYDGNPAHTSRCICGAGCSGSGSSKDAQNCQVPVVGPASGGGSGVCADQSGSPKLGCDGSGQCNHCTNDSQCPFSKCVDFGQCTWHCNWYLPWGSCGDWSPDCQGNAFLPVDAIWCQEMYGNYDGHSYYLGEAPPLTGGSCSADNGSGNGGYCGGLDIATGTWIPQCLCDSDSDCGANGTCLDRGGWVGDNFNCKRRKGARCGGSWGSCPSHQACNSGRCECSNDDQCGAHSRCACGEAGCTGSGPTDSFGCTTRTETACGSPTWATCPLGTKSTKNMCRCTANGQCGSGICAADPTYCTGPNCTGPAGTGGDDGCVTRCPATPPSCGVGYYDSASGNCFCNNDNQCGSGKCVPPSSGTCTGTGTGAGTCSGTGTPDANTHCQAEVTPNCVAACTSGKPLVAQNASTTCRCTSNSQCTSGKCVPAVGFCSSPTCTGTSTTQVDGCEPVSTASWTCNVTIPHSCAAPGQYVHTDVPLRDACVCTADSQCPSGQCGDRDAVCATGACSGPTVAASLDAANCVPLVPALSCTNQAQCGGAAGSTVEICADAAGNPPSMGYCTLGGVRPTCAKNADCSDRTYPATCTGAAGAVAGTCQGPGTKTGLSSRYFPEACQNSAMTDQEKALEFMFFDLTACVNPDATTPTPPAVKLNPATFPLSFAGTCPTGTRVQWRELDWQAVFPNPVNGSSIVFKAQTASTVAGIPGAQEVLLATTTSNTAVPAWDKVLLDTAPGGTGKLTNATPVVTSQAYLQVNVTMTPTTDQLSSPTLLAWKVVYDCPATE